MNILDFLKNNTPDNKRTAQFKQIRFSKLAGEDVIFTLQGLSFDRLVEINTNHPENSNLYVVLEGVVEPNLKDADLRKKYNVTGNEQLIKEIFLPGEIQEISHQVMVLSGYYEENVKELEKNSQSVQG